MPGLLHNLEFIVETIEDFVQIIYNFLSSLFTFMQFLGSVINVPFEVIGFLPTVFGVSALAVTVVGVVKTLLYGGIQ